MRTTTPNDTWSSRNTWAYGTNGTDGATRSTRHDRNDGSCRAMWTSRAMWSTRDARSSIVHKTMCPDLFTLDGYCQSSTHPSTSAMSVAMSTVVMLSTTSTAATNDDGTSSSTTTTTYASLYAVMCTFLLWKIS